MPRGGKKIVRKSGAVPGNSRDGSGRSGTAKSTEDPLYVELDQRMRTLQLPAACSFVFGIIERYVRSFSSHESFGSSLPTKESLLCLVDSYILKLPSTTTGDKTKKDSSSITWPFNVYEELELLDLLRVQIEERQSSEVQFALFDALFGLVGRDKQCHIKYCMKVLKQFVSLCVSMGCAVLLQCVAFWMEIYPIQAEELSKFIYFEFCELLPNAMDPVLGLCSMCPSMARLLTYHLTKHYHIYTTGDNSSLSNVHSLCPPLQLLIILSHWISATPEYIFVQTMLIETRDDHYMLRSKKPRTPTPSPLIGLVRWSIMEPLLSDKCLSRVPSVDLKGDKLVSQLRNKFSKLHADILTSLTSLSSSANASNLLTMDDFLDLVMDLLEYVRLTNAEEMIEKAIDRLAQILQAGLSTGIIRHDIDGLASLVSKLPPNRLMKLVLSRQRKPVRGRDH